MARVILQLAIAAALLSPARGFAQDVILLDTYQDDVIGDPPNGPEVGTYLQLVGDHTVDDFGAGDLKVLSRSADGDGYLINMQPIADPPLATSTYEFQLFGNSQLVGDNAVSQQWTLRPIGNNLSLWWSFDQELRVRIDRASGSSETIDTGFTWAFDTQYDVQVVTDGTSNTFSIRINGTDVLASEPFGEDFTHVFALAFADNVTSATQRVLNDVRMVNGACASEASPPVAELTTPPHLGTGCTCSNPEIRGTADDPDVGLGSYTVEYRPVSGGPWQEIATGDAAVIDDVLGTWSTGSVPEGLYNIRLTVTNACGLSSTSVRTIFLDKAFSNIELRSPDEGDVVGGEVCFDGTVFDGWCFAQYVAEYRPAGGGSWQPVEPNMPVYTATVVKDPFAFWDTAALGLADGDYDLRVIGDTECGNTDDVMRTVTVDNTSPVSEITTPVSCEYVTGVVDVIGTADDANLNRWTLQYTGAGSGWTTISTGNTPVIDGVLGTWDTSDLEACAYTLRLRVWDDANVNCTGNPHRSDDHVSLNVGCPEDIDGDGEIGLTDLSMLLTLYGGVCP